jgi:ubiquinone/menaquinone biosynthesis C-methylase UbiE
MYQVWKKHLPQGWKSRIAIAWYDLLSLLGPADDLLLLNHGYAASGAPALALTPAEERSRLQYQLYDHLAGKIDWTGREALEVSCGRGAGTAWIARTWRPRHVVGLDLSARSVAFARRHFAAPEVSFVHGDASELPYPEASLDIVINVESSINYPDMSRFLAEVARVLRPGGDFLLADYRRARAVEKLDRRIAACGLRLIEREEVGPAVARALAQDNARKAALVRRYLPRLLHRLGDQFAFVGQGPGSEQALFADGDKAYLCYHLRKPDAGDAPVALRGNV